GLESIRNEKDVYVFHAGTSFKNDHVVTSGGRVLGVTGLGADIAAARNKAYRAIEKIHFEGMHYRKDIAERALKRR
ncbi:MAG TPA: phosphoribosylglycinamide synthetase C domain-containing protein, partial [Thermodesulfovibrionales bacterium]|nr:phosphoribosylglycinamide synthetase C domain-containing protein [Thermodesulfovibrionales bacterium]